MKGVAGERDNVHGVRAMAMAKFDDMGGGSETGGTCYQVESEKAARRARRVKWAARMTCEREFWWDEESLAWLDFVHVSADLNFGVTRATRHGS